MRRSVQWEWYKIDGFEGESGDHFSLEVRGSASGAVYEVMAKANLERKADNPKAVSRAKKFLAAVAIKACKTCGQWVEENAGESASTVIEGVKLRLAKTDEEIVLQVTAVD